MYLEVLFFIELSNSTCLKTLEKYEIMNRSHNDRRIINKIRNMITEIFIFHESKMTRKCENFTIASKKNCTFAKPSLYSDTLL